MCLSLCLPSSVCVSHSLSLPLYLSLCVCLSVSPSLYGPIFSCQFSYFSLTHISIYLSRTLINFTVQFYSEFTESVRAGATAIFDGQIAPINPMDPEKTQVFVYNNIFYSRAVDTKENFKVRTDVSY